MNEPDAQAPPPNAPPSAPVKTAADAAVATGDVAAFKEARRAEKTGTPLGAPKADSRSAPPAEQAASTDALAEDASEAPDPAAPPKRGNAKTRIVEVDGEIATLKAKLAERDALRAAARAPAPDLPKPVPPATTPAATLPSELVSYDAYLEQHPTATLEEFFDARSDARQTLKEQAREAQTREQARTEAQAKRVTDFSKRVNEHATVDPTFVEQVAPAVLTLRPFAALKPGERGGPEQVIAEEILSSPVAPALMVALSKPEELARLMSLRSPAEIIRAIGKIEARYTADDGEPPPAYKPTHTPAPVTTLGKRPVDALAPLEAAIRDGDMTAYKQARQAERAARYARR